MSKWDDKLHIIRAMIQIGLDSSTIAEALDTTAANIQTVCKRNAIKLPTHRTRHGAGMVCQIPLGMLCRDMNQPRKVFDQAKLEELAEALKTEGQESPIRFRVSDIENNPERTPFMVIHGERRCRAAVIAGLDTIEGVLDTRPCDASERILRQISDNAQRADLTPWDWVVAIDSLHKSGLTHEAISQQLTARGLKGFSRPVVSNYLRLVQLPAEAIDLLKEGKITPAHGKYLLQCKDTAMLKIVAEHLAGDGPAPTVDKLRRDIAWQYERNHRGLNCWGQCERARFDWETTCKDCEHCHKIDAEHTYCANPIDECFNGHQAAADRRVDAERQATDQAVERAMEGCDLDDLKRTDPEEAARIEKMAENRKAWKKREEESERRKALEQKMADAVESVTDIDVLLVCAMQYLLEESDTTPSTTKEADIVVDLPTPTQWLEAFRCNRIELLQSLASEAMRGWLNHDTTPHYAAMLGLDPNKDYRETDQQGDTEEAA